MMSNFFFSQRSRQRWYPFLSLIVALSLWISSTLPGQAIPWFNLIFQGVQVVQLSHVSDQQEVELGKQINQELLGSQVQLYRNPDLTRYVNQVGQRLAANSGRSNIPYTFQVVKDNSINAFATMGGFVYVNSGLVKAADNEAQLASVLGHEIGHIGARHVVHQMRQTAIERGLATAVGLDNSTLAQIGLDLAVRRPSSRQHEYEADQRGLQTIGRSGYAQSAMVDFMQKLLQTSSPPTFLSDHPATADRIAVLKQTIDPRKAVGDGLDSSAYRANIQPLLH